MVCLNCKISFVQRKCIASLQKMWRHLAKSVLLLFILNTVFRSHHHIYNHFHNYYLMHKMCSLREEANLRSKFGLQLGLYLKRECYSFNNFTFFIHPLTTGLFRCFLLFFCSWISRKIYLAKGTLPHVECSCKISRLGTFSFLFSLRCY